MRRTAWGERLLMEQLDYNLLFRWLVGLGMDDRVWDPTAFTKNRQRLLERHRAAAKVNWVFATAIYNLIRNRNVRSAPA